MCIRDRPRSVQFAGYTPLTPVTLRNALIGFGEPDDGRWDTSSRFKYFLSQAIGCNANEVEGMVIGGHGDTTMIPLTRFATYKGMPVANFISAEKLEEVAAATMVGGATLTKLLGTDVYKRQFKSLSITTLVSGLAEVCCLP